MKGMKKNKKQVIQNKTTKGSERHRENRANGEEIELTDEGRKGKTELQNKGLRGWQHSSKDLKGVKDTTELPEADNHVAFIADLGRAVNTIAIPELLDSEGQNQAIGKKPYIFRFLILELYRMGVKGKREEIEKK
jgi:hypothetical protein